MALKVSTIIRTYNEQRHLAELLAAISSQKTDFHHEIIIVDSGSTDRTLEIAGQFNCRIVQIPKREFTFGRSLNIGCDAAFGDILTFISGHCVPCGQDWLTNLVSPIRNGIVEYSYGRQLGRDTTKFSETQVFSKYFPATSRIPQDGFFCNNANAALSKEAWKRYRFDEQLTGLEDLKLAKALVADGAAVAYVAEAPVFHIHDESWHQVRIRYEREALALREIMPEIHVGFFDFVRYLFGGVSHDFGAAFLGGSLMSHAADIVAFRLMQFWGTYKGNRKHRQLSAQQREEYFYPKPSKKTFRENPAHHSSTYESS